MHTSKNLSLVLDRYNADLPEDHKLHLNWGREGRRATWFFHEAYGANLRTGLSFSDVRDALINAIRENDEYIAS